MNNDYEKLKTLLFKDEMADLASFRQLLEDDDALAKKLSQVLEQASDLTIKKSPSFSHKFAPNNPDIYLNVLKRDPKGLMALLTPIISPVIRSAVLQSMRRFISEVNRTLEMGFSPKYFKWRWQAFRTGVPLSEIVFENTIQYQVQQLFLIDKETGLLVEYVGQEDQLIQDKEAMSAMLTAIQDFVSDSLTSDTGTLSAAELGDDLLWVLPGADFNLAALIKGAPSNRLRTQLADLLSHLHVKYSHDFKDQSMWNNHIAARHDMSQHLVQKDLNTDKKMTLWPWLVIILLASLWFTYISYNKQQKISDMRSRLNQVPGLLLDELTWTEDQFIATGLKDPLSDTTEFNNVTFNTQNFYALEDSLIQKRARQYINDKKIAVNVQGGEITLSGTRNPSHDWQPLLLIPGINKVTDKTQTLAQALTLETRLNQFIEKHHTPFDLNISLDNDKIMVTGQVKESDWPAYLALLTTSFSNLSIEGVQQIPSRATLVNQINESPLLIKGLHTLSDNNKLQLQQIIEWDRQIAHFYEPGLLVLHSRSDCQGSLDESIENNKSRLSLVRNFLLQSGIASQQTQSINEACESLSEVVDPDKIGIWFEKK